ncbi:ASCH domain-containing protein [Vibrio rumoiensis]|uniref:RNA-binding protein n=1 Tax=Vibrio rumoiensis 1S-45 TaxID=1188252 RepID=A0A1E5E5M9_9VIBR|nr:ASCH domain-containing protein [Vibrio rumoiensis]OEF29206.1 RNA-binding protein [Vibrio rumoiensis 1S-45]
MTPQTKSFLNHYLFALNENLRRRYTSFSADYFCSTEKDANTCADLVVKGEKTATCSLKYWYDVANEPVPTVGHLQVVLNWQGEPQCIIETTEVFEIPFNAMTEEFAFQEGEGDKSLDHWKMSHRDFFEKECQQENIEFDDTMMLVCERFKKVYP